MLHPTPPRVLQAGSRVTFMTAAYQQIWTGGGEKEEMGWLKERGWKWEQSGEGREGGERRRKREQHRLEMWVMVRVIRQSLLEDVRSVVLGCSHEKGTEIVVFRIKKEGWERSSDPGFFLTSTQLTTEWTSDCRIWKATETVWHGHPLIWSERGGRGRFQLFELFSHPTNTSDGVYWPLMKEEK